jgi:hypothetical protein
MSENNDLELWITDSCTQQSGVSALSDQLYTSFSEFKKRNGENAASSKSFSQRLERIFPKKRTNRGMVFEGLRLNSTINPVVTSTRNCYADASRGS